MCERELVVTSKKTRRRKRLKIFGSISWDWLCHAAKLPTRPLRTALLLCLLRGLQRNSTVKVEYGKAKDLGMSRYAVYRELSALESAGLVVVDRHRGRCPRVTLIEFPKD